MIVRGCKLGGVCVGCGKPPGVCGSWKTFFEVIEIHTKSNRALIPSVAFDEHGNMHACHLNCGKHSG